MNKLNRTLKSLLNKTPDSSAEDVFRSGSGSGPANEDKNNSPEDITEATSYPVPVNDIAHGHPVHSRAPVVHSPYQQTTTNQMTNSSPHHHHQTNNGNELVAGGGTLPRLIRRISSRAGIFSEVTTDINSTGESYRTTSNNDCLDNSNSNSTSREGGDASSLKSSRNISRARSLSTRSIDDSGHLPPPVLARGEDRWGQFETENLEAESWKASATAIATANARYAEPSARYAELNARKASLKHDEESYAQSRSPSPPQVQQEKRVRKLIPRHALVRVSMDQMSDISMNTTNFGGEEKIGAIINRRLSAISSAGLNEDNSVGACTSASASTSLSADHFSMSRALNVLTKSRLVSDNVLLKNCHDPNHFDLNAEEMDDKHLLMNTRNISAGQLSKNIHWSSPHQKETEGDINNSMPYTKNLLNDENEDKSNMFTMIRASALLARKDLILGMSSRTLADSQASSKINKEFGGDSITTISALTKDTKMQSLTSVFSNTDNLQMEGSLALRESYKVLPDEAYDLKEEEEHSSDKSSEVGDFARFGASQYVSNDAPVTPSESPIGNISSPPKESSISSFDELSSKGHSYELDADGFHDSPDSKKSVIVFNFSDTDLLELLNQNTTENEDQSISSKKTANKLNTGSISDQNENSELIPTLESTIILGNGLQDRQLHATSNINESFDEYDFMDTDMICQNKESSSIPTQQESAIVLRNNFDPEEEPSLIPIQQENTIALRSTFDQNKESSSTHIQQDATIALRNSFDEKKELSLIPIQQENTIVLRSAFDLDNESISTPIQQESNIALRYNFDPEEESSPIPIQQDNTIALRNSLDKNKELGSTPIQQESTIVLRNSFDPEEESSSTPIQQESNIVLRYSFDPEEESSSIPTQENTIVLRNSFDKNIESSSIPIQQENTIVLRNAFDVDKESSPIPIQHETTIALKSAFDQDIEPSSIPTQEESTIVLSSDFNQTNESKSTPTQESTIALKNSGLHDLQTGLGKLKEQNQYDLQLIDNLSHGSCASASHHSNVIKNDIQKNPSWLFMSYQNYSGNEHEKCLATTSTDVQSHENPHLEANGSIDGTISKSISSIEDPFKSFDPNPEYHSKLSSSATKFPHLDPEERLLLHNFYHGKSTTGSSPATITKSLSLKSLSLPSFKANRSQSQPPKLTNKTNDLLLPVIPPYNHNSTQIDSKIETDNDGIKNIELVIANANNYDDNGKNILKNDEEASSTGIYSHSHNPSSPSASIDVDSTKRSISDFLPNEKEVEIGNRDGLNVTSNIQHESNDGRENDHISHTPDVKCETVYEGDSLRSLTSSSGSIGLRISQSDEEDSALDSGFIPSSSFSTIPSVVDTSDGDVSSSSKMPPVPSTFELDEMNIGADSLTVKETNNSDNDKLEGSSIRSNDEEETNIDSLESQGDQHDIVTTQDSNQETTFDEESYNGISINNPNDDARSHIQSNIEEEKINDSLESEDEQHNNLTIQDLNEETRSDEESYGEISIDDLSGNTKKENQLRLLVPASPAPSESSDMAQGQVKNRFIRPQSGLHLDELSHPSHSFISQSNSYDDDSRGNHDSEIPRTKSGDKIFPENVGIKAIPGNSELYIYQDDGPKLHPHLLKQESWNKLEDIPTSSRDLEMGTRQGSAWRVDNNEDAYTLLGQEDGRSQRKGIGVLSASDRGSSKRFSKNRGYLIVASITFSLIFSVSLAVGLMTRTEQSPSLILTPGVPNSPPTLSPSPKVDSNVDIAEDHAFVTKKWTEIASIHDFDKSHDISSIAMATLKNGEFRLVVGARKYSEGDGSPRTGIVNVYDLIVSDDESNVSWKRVFSLEGERGDDEFGYSISISGDGLVLAIGAPGYDSVKGSDANEGCIYIYDLTSKSTMQRSHLHEGETNAVSDTVDIVTKIIGIAAAEQLGYSCALDETGKFLAGGAPYHGNVGTVRVFKKGLDTKWNLVGNELFGSETADLFGASVSISNGGDQLVVGAPREPGSSQKGGYVTTYNLKLNKWKQMGSKINPSISARDAFGKSISQSSDGTRLFVGSPAFAQSRGIARLYRKKMENWMEVGNISGTLENDNLGASLAMSQDTNKFAVSTSGSAQVLKLNQERGDWVIAKAITVAEERLGELVAMIDKGRLVSVASPGKVRSYYQL